MPTSSYLTNRNSSYLSPSEYRKPSSLLTRHLADFDREIRREFGRDFGRDFGFRRSSLFDTIRSNFEDDRAAFRSRFGVSTPRALSSASIPTTSSLSRISADRDYRKPPIGSGRLRSESRARDLSLDSGYTSSPKYNTDSTIPSTTKTASTSTSSSPSSLKNPNRLSTSSLARSVATSGADLYAKYSPSNYKPNCELSRSRSLTDSTVDSLSDKTNHVTNDKTTTRPSLKDRSSGLPPSSASAVSSSRLNGTLPAGNSAHTKDYLNNRESSPLSSTAAAIKVKTCGNNIALTNSLAHSRCSYSNASTNNQIQQNNNNTIINNKKTERKLNIGKNVCNNNNINNNNNNNNCLSDSIVVSTLTKTNNNHSIAISNKKSDSVSINVRKSTGNSGIGAHANSINGGKSMSSKVSKVYLSSSSATPTTTLSHSSASRIPIENGKKATASLSSSDSFKKRLGANPMSPYKNPDFLKCEYDLARSQVINSRSKSASNETNNNITKKSQTKDSNLNKITIFGVNEPKKITPPPPNAVSLTNGHQTISDKRKDEMNGIASTKDPLDDIKFIDCDDTERKQSPDASSHKTPSVKDLFKENLTNQSSTTSTLPPSASAKMMTNIYQKYNTIQNGVQLNSSSLLIDGELAIANKAIAEDMSSSTSSASSTSTLSSIDISAKSQNASTNKKLLSTDGSVDSARSEEIRSRLPPTPSRLTSRKYSDGDSFTRSLAASSISEKNEEDSEGLCGLRNIGNTCFMNSIIQCLGHTKELTKYLKTKCDSRSGTSKDIRIVNEFAKLIKEMWSGQTRSVTPSELKSAFSSKHRMYSGCSQQDAQEFLRFFLDALHCALNTGSSGEKLHIDDNLSTNRKADLTWEWYSKVEKSVVTELFVGQLKSSLKCTACGNTSDTFDPFWDLSVPLPTSSRCKLESCLDLFIKEEILDGDEMPTCSKCKTRKKSTKSFTIQRFPKYLAIHLKRFSETRWSKLSNIVEFPTGERELNMAPYAANASTSAQYSLYGICNHMGSTAGGHYVALCKHPVTHKWHEFNDNVVNPAHESSLVSSSAYVLFYERV